jgi:type IV pilus assembly protein PilA
MNDLLERARLAFHLLYASPGVTGARRRSSWPRVLTISEKEMLRLRKGFTLIELLIVVVIIGILAAIAIPKFASTKEKAYLASEKSDLRNMATSEEAYFSGNQTYTTNQSAMDFTTSQGVSITGMVADAKGWKGTSSHSATTKKCYAGFGSQAAATTLDGIITCDP